MNIFHKAIDYNIPLTKEVSYRTWKLTPDNSDWVIEMSIDFSSSSILEINTWYKEIMIKTLKAFSALIRVWQVALIPSPESHNQVLVFNWEKENSYQEYLQKVIQEIEYYPSIIEELEIKIDLRVFVETTQFLNHDPILSWIRCGDEILIHSEAKDGDPYLYLSLKHSLFAFSTFDINESNKKLYLLNQPLLEKALQSWEQKIGTISEFDGIEGIYEYGFLPEEY